MRKEGIILTVMESFDFKKMFKSGLFACFLLFVASLDSCKYDDTELMNRIDGLEERLANLEDLCKQINVNVNSLQVLITAMEEHDYITSVSEVVEEGVHIGYKIEFAQSDPIIVYHGKDGSSGADGYVPQIGVEKDTDGIYYWTLDGEWLTDEEGNKIRAVGRDGQDGHNGSSGSDGEDGEDGKDGRDGVTPQIRIQDERWEVSYDNGKTWKDLGPATGSASELPITSVKVEEQYVVFTLNTQEEIKIPLYTGLAITFDKTEIETVAGTTTEVPYSLTAGNTDDVQVTAIGEGVSTRVDAAEKKLIITTNEDFTEGKVLVHATDGNNVSVVELTVKGIVVTYIEYTATKQLVPSCSDYLADLSTYNPTDGSGKVAIKGTIKTFDGNSYAFGTNSNKDLKTIKIPEGVEKIADDSFASCVALEKVEFPSTLKSIGGFAFSNTSLKDKIIIPEGVTSIGKGAFKCDNSDSNPTYTEIDLPSTLQEIGMQAFRGSMDISREYSVYCKAVTPPTKTGNKEIFSDKATIYVPKGSVDAYKAADGWKYSKYTIKAME